MKKLNKKAFTIVELIVVIVIIGILAAILIPNVVKYIDQTKIVKDKELVSNLNKALVLDKTVKGIDKHETAYDAVLAAKESGYLVANINKASKGENEILWDSLNDLFCYLDTTKGNTFEEQLTYVPNYEPEKNPVKSQLFKFYKGEQVSAETKFSVYLGEGATLGEGEYHVGIDVGEETNISEIKFYGLNVVNEADRHDVVIRTNSFDTTLTINAPKDTVKHYDKVGSLNVIAVANASYHENGQVKFVEISKGRIALEASAEVAHIHINTKTTDNGQTYSQTVFDEVIISYDKSVDLTEVGFSRNDVEIAATGTLVVALQAGTEEITESTELDYVWLTKQGIYEQIKVSDNDQSAGTVWADDSSNSAETQDAAQKIANNYVSETVRPTWNPENTTRDLADINNATAVATAVAQEEAGDEWENMSAEEQAAAVTSKEAVVVDATQAVEAQPDKDEIKTETTTFIDGKGTENDPFIIYTSTDFSNITKIAKNEKVWYKLANDINYDVTSLGNYNYVAEMINGDLDLNGKTLSISTENTNMIIGVGKYAKVHNGSINMNGDVALFDEMDYSLQATLVVDNVDFTGNVTPGGWGPHYGIIDCYAGNTSNNKTIVSTVIINNVNSWVSIKANATCVGGLLGYCLRANVSITNSSVYSYIESGYGAGGIIMSDSQVCGYESDPAAIAVGQTWGTVENVKFYGNILVPEGKKAYYFGHTVPTGQDSDYAGSSATLVKGINIDNDILVAENGEFKINGSSNYTRYVVRYSFSVDYLDDRAGGYPRVIEKEFSNDTNQVISTGLYKNKVKEGSFNSTTDTYVTDGSNGIFTRTDESGTYFYDGIGTYKLSKYGVTVTVYAYNGESLKAVGSYSYPKE